MAEATSVRALIEQHAGKVVRPNITIYSYGTRCPRREVHHDITFAAMDRDSYDRRFTKICKMMHTMTRQFMIQDTIKRYVPDCNVAPDQPDLALGPLPRTRPSGWLLRHGPSASTRMYRPSLRTHVSRSFSDLHHTAEAITNNFQTGQRRIQKKKATAVAKRMEGQVTAGRNVEATRRKQVESCLQFRATKEAPGMAVSCRTAGARMASAWLIV